jgi:hypothetical protein
MGGNGHDGRAHDGAPDEGPVGGSGPAGNPVGGSGPAENPVGGSGPAENLGGGGRGGSPIGGGEGGADGPSAAAAAGPAGPADPGELLGEVRAIRRRARLARHAYWFPLVLFGLLTCASVPFYLRQIPVDATGPEAFLARLPGHPLPLGGFFGGYHGLLPASDVAYYWLGAMLLGISATVLWYRWRGNRIGLRTPARGYLITGLALVALALLIPVASGRSLRLPLIWPGGYEIRGAFPLVLIGLALCVLAWSERSTGLAVIAAGYLALSVVANLYILNNVLYRLHWNLSPAAAAVPNVLLPALVLLLTGAGAWVVQRRYGPPAEFEPEG